MSQHIKHEYFRITHASCKDAMHRLSADEVERKLEAARQKLLFARDDKSLTGWNGLVLAAFAEAAREVGAAQG